MLTPSTTATAADAEALFRANPISSIRTIESETQLLINTKSQDLRTLVGTRYRDLIDSADSIVHMKSTCESISSNLNSIHLSLTQALSLSAPSPSPPNPTRPGVYSTACRVKYLVDTSEHIWGCLDESMFLEGANRYVRAKHVHQILEGNNGMSSNSKLLVNFPLLQHQWMIVESFKGQISTRSRERLLIDGLRIEDYADALGAVVVIDEIDDPKKVLWLFLETRKAWIKQKLGNLNNGELNSDAAVKVFVEVLRIIQLSLGQVGQLFLRVLNDMPLFYKVVLSTPPASQLYGGIPNPDEEVRLWNLFRDELESVMVVLDREFVASSCCEWLKDCGDEIVSRVNGKFLVDAFVSGEELALAEKSIRETVESKEVLESCLEWLKSVFGSEIELPWSRTRELVLGNDADLWEEIFEESFVRRMKKIIDLGFQDLVSSVNVKDTIRTIQGSLPGDQNDFQAFLLRSSLGGGVWFTDSNTKKANVISSKAPAKENDIHSCLNAYFGPEVGEIRDAVDSRCQGILVDLIRFLESPKAASRLNDLVPYLQSRCYESMSTILSELRTELDNLYSVLDDSSRGESVMPSIAVERALFIGRLLFALQNHSKHVPVILGSPRSWVKENVMAGFEKLPSMFRHSRGPIDSPMHDSLGRQVFGNSKRKNSLVAMALLAVTDSASPKLEELNEVTRDLCIRAYNLWISWVSDELSIILSQELRHDDALSATTPLRGWEETTAKQVESDESQSGMKISLPSLPSLYITSFLFQACEEIHRVGGHVLDKSILQKFAQRFLEKAIGVYEHLLSTEQALEALVSEKGILQLLLDVRFVADVLSGGDVNVDENSLKSPVSKFPFRRKLESNQSKSVKQVNSLLNRLSQRLDPIDWQTYEPYLWENERQAYLRHAVLFGFFVQLHRMFTNTAQKLSAQPVSNILRCSTVPRFKYLPISAPALSSRGSNKASTSTSSEDLSSHNSWKAYANGDLSPKIGFDEKTSFGVATPFLKSFMQVGSRFGESTMKLGSILTDGQVGIFKDRSASAMPSFGDILPVQAAGLLSSFTATRSDST